MSLSQAKDAHEGTIGGPAYKGIYLMRSRVALAQSWSMEADRYL